MDFGVFRSGFQAALLATPGLDPEVSDYPAEGGDVQAVFYHQAPQEARTPYLVWHIVAQVVRYDSCGEAGVAEATVQLDVHGATASEVDDLSTVVSDHLSYLSGPFADVVVGAVFAAGAGDEMPEDVESERNEGNPVRRLEFTIHWTDNS